jgi:hypothetical protein
MAWHRTGGAVVVDTRRRYRKLDRSGPVWVATFRYRHFSTPWACLHRPAGEPLVRAFLSNTPYSLSVYTGENKHAH